MKLLLVILLKLHQRIESTRAQKGRFIFKSGLMLQVLHLLLRLEVTDLLLLFQEIEELNIAHLNDRTVNQDVPFFLLVQSLSYHYLIKIQKDGRNLP